MLSYIQPNAWVALRLPSGVLKILQIPPNTIISIGKYGSFPANLILGRPYHLTFELVEADHEEKNKAATQLRIVSVAELHAEALTDPTTSTADAREEIAEDVDGGVEFDIVGENGEVIMRSNRLTVDDPSRQALSYQEIEELKKAGAGSGKEIIAKIMASHLNLDEKTKFSLAKYTLRKSRKYMKRFTILPLDVAMLVSSMLEREANRILEVREETLGLISSWANIHYGGSSRIHPAPEGEGYVGGGRWLVVDDAGGILVASLAERMGLLHTNEDDADYEPGEKRDENLKEASVPTEQSNEPMDVDQDPGQKETLGKGTHDSNSTSRPKSYDFVPGMSATTNTLTVIHPAAQPNLGLLRYFGYDTSAITPSHPFHTHLKTISWPQLLHPNEDPGYEEPEIVPQEELETWKAGKRGTYYRKRRRWERVRRVINETRAGGFDGLVVASTMDPKDILKHTVPLLRGGAQVVIYSATPESLVEVMDLYSKERRTAFVQESSSGEPLNEEDFPVNPTLLLAPMLQTARARHWQVLPGRTHPMMMSRGLADGYVFSATRVLPVDGPIEARGNFSKRRKVPTEAVATNGVDGEKGQKRLPETSEGQSSVKKSKQTHDAV